MADLDATRLAKIVGGCSADCADAGCAEHIAMAREILRRRAEDLTAADRESLRWARGVAELPRNANLRRQWPEGVTCDGMNQAEFVARAERALAVLDRLIGGKL